jgi:hypothetical protein
MYEMEDKHDIDISKLLNDSPLIKPSSSSDNNNNKILFIRSFGSVNKHVLKTRASFESKHKNRLAWSELLRKVVSILIIRWFGKTLASQSRK